LIGVASVGDLRGLFFGRLFPGPPRARERPSEKKEHELERSRINMANQYEAQLNLTIEGEKKSRALRKEQARASSDAVWPSEALMLLYTETFDEFRFAARLLRDLTSAWRMFKDQWQPLGAVVFISAVGFFDIPHTQKPHAPNFAELHPVTGLKIVSGC
jgi:hypothetical protein